MFLVSLAIAACNLRLVYLLVSVFTILCIIVKLLISYGGSVNQRDCNGNTPLHLGTSS